MELETLKDLKFFRYKKPNRKGEIEKYEDFGVVTKTQLRKLAIKWVKTAQEVKEGEIIHVRKKIKELLTNKKNDICDDLIFLFKLFFNLTEEDLK